MAQIIINNPTHPKGTATPADVRAGETFQSSDGAGVHTGTATDNGVQVITPGIANQSLEGFYATGSAVQGDGKLLPANIRKDTVLFGVTGTLEGATPPTGDATAADVLLTKTFESAAEAGAGTGSMPNNGSVTITPGPNDQAIPLGYHDGLGKVSGVVVPAADVKTGTTIAGTAGTMPVNVAPTTTLTTNGASKVVPAGYNPGGTIDVSITNLIAGNIKDNAIVGGVTGTFSELANGATAAQILTGRSAAVNGTIVNGSMPDRAGDTVALSSAVAGTTLRLRASDGYRDGTNDYVTITDADWIAANIVSGKNIFGVAGSASDTNIKSIQRGFITLSNASTNYTISTIDPTKSILIFFFSGNNNNSDNQVSGQIVNATTINFAKITTSQSAYIEYQVIEFYNVKSKQSGSTIYDTTSVTQAINSVVPTKCILFASYDSKNTGTSLSYSFLLACTISSPTQLGFYSLNSIPANFKMNVLWQLLEFN